MTFTWGDYSLAHIMDLKTSLLLNAHRTSLALPSKNIFFDWQKSLVSFLWLQFSLSIF